MLYFFIAALIILLLLTIVIAPFVICTICSGDPKPSAFYSRGTGGQLSLLEPSWRDNFLCMHFEYEGGGGCRVYAVERLELESLGGVCIPDAILFIMENGAVVDYHQGDGAFASDDMLDWLSMKRQVERAWGSARDAARSEMGSDR